MKKATSILLLFMVIGVLLLGYECKSQAVDAIPTYSGTASVEINENIPEFKRIDLTTASYEKYGKLDKLGRCTQAMACIGKELMPTKDRESIGMVKPTGWDQNKYPGVVDSEPPYLYNRCHMIGFQLTGENANERNLITGTLFTVFFL